MSEAQAALRTLIWAYVAGDRTARLALVDWLEERGDARAEEVRAAKLDWDAVAWAVFVERNPGWESYSRADAILSSGVHPHLGFTSYHQAELGRIRWYVDCALFGGGAREDVTRAVRKTHRDWLARLFPEAADALLRS